MTDTRTETSSVRDRIENWLARTRGSEISVGRDQELAVLNARKLRTAILTDGLQPESLTVDEELKEALSTLLSLLLEADGTPSERLDDANDVYQFIKRLDWTADPLGEKRDLLLECAEIGWAAIGLSARSVMERRVALSNSCDAEVYAGTFRQQLDALRNQVFLESESTRDRGTRLHRATLFRVCTLVAIRGDDDPMAGLEACEDYYRQVVAGKCADSLLDESEHLAAMFALLAGTGCRILGRFESAEGWFDLAERHVGHTLDIEPLSAKLAYGRATISFQRGDMAEALAQLLVLARKFDRWRMTLDSVKTRFVMAMSLNAMGEWQPALRILEDLAATEAVQESPALHAHLFVYQAGCLTELDRYSEAEHACAKAASLLLGGNHPSVHLPLKWAVADLLKRRNNLAGALAVYQEVLDGYSNLGFESVAAELRLVMAELSLELDEPITAEGHIRAALKTIEQGKMVSVGYAAVALLNESLRRRKTDRKALRELREHLKANK